MEGVCSNVIGTFTYWDEQWIKAFRMLRGQ
jgi:hypothetical protein